MVFPWQKWSSTSKTVNLPEYDDEGKATKKRYDVKLTKESFKTFSKRHKILSFVPRSSPDSVRLTTFEHLEDGQSYNIDLYPKVQQSHSHYHYHGHIDSLKVLASGSWQRFADVYTYIPSGWQSLVAAYNYIPSVSSVKNYLWSSKEN